VGEGYAEVQRRRMGEGCRRPPHHHLVRPRQRKDARAMRRVATDAEQKLWFLLRDRRLDGVKFRRQVPFGPCILDFVCFVTDTLQLARWRRAIRPPRL